MSARIPIPATPAALLDVAKRPDRVWADFEARGVVKPTLEEEFALLERQNEAGPRA